jgi:hypothetical protein
LYRSLRGREISSQEGPGTGDRHIGTRHTRGHCPRIGDIHIGSLCGDARSVQVSCGLLRGGAVAACDRQLFDLVAGGQITSDLSPHYT